MLRWIRVGLVLLAGGLTWFLFAGTEPAPNVASVPSTATEVDKVMSQEEKTARARAGTASLPVPVRMSATSPQPGNVQPKATSASLRDRFAEASPPAGESRHAELVRDVVNTLLPKDSTTKVLGLECRSEVCLLRVGGDDDASVMKLVDALQDERGFYGKAESMMMSRDADSIHIYLQFAQDTAPSKAGSSIEGS